jgi:hypothetical protein
MSQEDKQRREKRLAVSPAPQDAMEVIHAFLQSMGLPKITKGVVLTQTGGLGNVTVNHGLRAKPRGWVVLRSIGPTGAAFSEVDSDENQLTLNLSTTVTFTIWVYALCLSRSSSLTCGPQVVFSSR